MSLYDRYVLPYVLDLACGLKPIRGQRAKIVPMAQGKVLEVGIGTGLNLRHYDHAKVCTLCGLDPAPQMHRLARKRAQQAGLAVELLNLPADTIPSEDASFDTVVMTYTLCSIPQPLPALRELKRVLRPGGKLLFCEHGAAPDASVHAWQQRLNPSWGKIAGGCQLDREVPRLLQEGGFRIEQLDQAYLPGPRPLTYNYWGVAG